MGKGGDSNAGLAVKRAGKNKPVTKFSWNEVKKHNTPEDAWVVYHNKVYDVSNWLEHPGGTVIFTHAGDDMTDIFAMFHAAGSHNMIKKFYIGDLDVPTRGEDDQQIAFKEGYRNLLKQLIEMGMFKSNKWFYVYKVASQLVLWSIAMAMVYYSDSVLVHAASAVLLGLFFQQCGWLAHDFLHHQVFKKRRYGDYAGLFIGNVMQGFSVQWWKNKHNGHHSVPNLHNSSLASQDGDPDIDTMPVLAWSLKQAQSFRERSPDGKDSAFVKFMIRNQTLFYFPILCLARLSWLRESLKVSFNLGAASENAALEMKVKGLQYPMGEKIGMFVHYTWVLMLCSGFGRWSAIYGAAYFLLATCSSGVLLALVFGLGHNGMAVYDAETRPDFWKLQVTTTRNITGGHGIPQAFVDWFCGGLQYQVEHHLFCMIPRHNLPKTHELVVSFCKEWGVSYHEADLVDGTYEVLHHLQYVSDEFVREFVEDGPTM